MKKKTFLVSALSAFLLVLSACNGAVIDDSSSGSKSDSSASSSQPTTSSGGGGGGGSSSIAPSSSDEPSSSSQEESSSEEQPSSSQEESSSEEQPSSSQEESSSSESGSSSSEVVTQYTITYASNGGTGTMEAVTKDEGSKYALPECGFTKEGYDFDYWTIDNESDHRAPGYEFTVNGDVTVTANWKEATPAFVPCLYVSEDNWATKAKIELEPGESAGVYFKTLTLKEGSSFFAQASEEEYYHWGELSAIGNYSQICFAEATDDSHNIDVKKTSEYVIALYTESALGAGLVASSSYDNEDYVLFGVENSGSKSLSYDADLDAFTGEITGKTGSQAAVKIGEEEYTCEENKMYLHNKEGQLNNLKYEDDKYTLINDVEKAQVEVYLGENGAISVFLENQTETKYYLVGKINGQEKWTATDYDFKANTEAEGEYLLNDYISLKKDDGVKAMNIKGYAYYPAGNEKELKINEDGEYMIYFRPDGQGGEGWHEGYLYIEKKAEPVQQATSIKVNGGDPIVLDSDGSALVTAPANAIITGLVDTTPVALTAKTDEGNNVVAGENAGEIKVVKEVTNARIWVDEKNNVWLNDYTEDTSVYLLYKNGDSEHPFTLTLNGTTHEAAIKATRGDYFTVTKDGNPYTITAENFDGNNVKIINEKLTVLTGADQDLTFYLHSDENHTVWLTGYVANEYFLTIGTNAAVQLTQSEEQGKEYEYVAFDQNVKAGDAITVMHDQQSYTITRKAGDDNNINTLALTIHNDCDSADVYLDVVNENHPIWISGYQETPVVYTYYIEKIHGESVSDKIQLQASSPADVIASGANEQYEYEYASLVGGDYVRFYYSNDNGVNYTQFGNNLTIEDGQNLNYTTENGKFVIIANRNEATKLYLKIKGGNYSVRLDGYSQVISFKVGKNSVDLVLDGNEYKGSITSASTTDVWKLEIDRREVELHAKGDAGNNVVTNAGVTTVIRPIESATNVYIDKAGWIWCDGYYNLYDAYVGETKVATGVKTGEGLKISAEAGSIIRLKVNGGEDFANIYVKTPGDNNVKATDDPTKLLVIKTVVASESDNMWINEGNNIWLSGYALEYNVQIGENRYLMTKSEDSEKGADTWDEQYKLLAHDLTAGQVLIFNKDYNTKVGISSVSGNLAKDGEGVITAKTTFTSDIYLKRYGENWVVWASCDDSYYLRGGLNDWKSKAAYRFTKCTGGEAKVDGKDQYSLKDVVVTGEGDDLKFKAFSIDTYLPDGDDLVFPSAGTYDIYFAPDGGVSYKDWTDFDSRGYFYIAKHPEPQSLAVVVSGTVTEGNCVSGSNITITLTYDDASHEAVAADVEGIKYTLNGGAQITYSTLVTTPLNATAQLRVIYRGVTSDPVAITVVEYVNNYTSVAIKDTAGTADYNDGALFVGDHYQATATGVKTDSEEEPTDSFVWSSSDETVATVTQAGYIVAVGAGTATITLASNANPSTVKDTCVITVSEHTYFTAKINDEGDAISFDPIDKSDSWVSHSEINFKAGDTLAVYYDGVKQTYTAAVSAEDHNNLDGTEGILTPGKCYVYLNPTSETAGTIWVKGYARITYNGTSYAADHMFDNQEKTLETYYIQVDVAHGQNITAGVIGGSNKTLTLAGGAGNNLKVVSTELTILTTAENTTIYMHDYDDNSVWVDNYAADYKIKIGGNDPVSFTSYDSEKKEYVYTGNIASDTVIAIYDNGYDDGFAYDSSSGNNLNSDMEIINGGYISLYAKVGTKNVWANQPVYVTKSFAVDETAAAYSERTMFIKSFKNAETHYSIVNAGSVELLNGTTSYIVGVLKAGETEVSDENWEAVVDKQTSYYNDVPTSKITLYYVSGTGNIVIGLDDEPVDTNIYNITFNVTTDNAVDRVYIAGLDGWSLGGEYALTKQGDTGKSWTGVFPLSGGNYSYKVVTYATSETTDENANWEDGEDRQLTVSSASTITVRYGYRNITFELDMGVETPSENGIHIAGTMNGWNTSKDALTLKSGTVYTITVQCPTGTNSFKFVNGNTNNDYESGSINREWYVDRDITISTTYKWNVRRISVELGEWDSATDNDVFYASAWGGGLESAWYAFSAGNDYVEIPMACNQIILVRMNGDHASVPSWDAKWNQTEDMDVHASGKLVFSTWSGGAGSKSQFDWA